MNISRNAALAGLMLIGSLGLVACDNPLTQEAFGRKVRTYLLENPEVLAEAMAKLEAKQALAASGMLERDPRDFVANPAGTVTVVEFYDYNCAYCIRAAGPVQALIKSRPDVRVVFKELPIFGGVSDQAARVALAARAQGKDYLAVHTAMMSARPLTDQSLTAIQTRFGIDMAKADLTVINRHIADNQQLASQLGINGTPTFVVGDTTIPGADMDAVMAAIAQKTLVPKA